MADDCVSVTPTPAKRCRLSISRGDISPLNTSGTTGETLYAGARLGSMDMFAASDSGFSELTSSGSSEDDQPTSANDDLCRSEPGPAFLNTSRDEDLEEDQEANEEEEEEEDDDDSSSSSSSDVSVISGLSDLGGHDWEPNAGSMTWVQQQMNSGMDPRRILADLVPNAAQIPSHLDDVTLWKIIVNIVSEPPRRKKLDDVNTLDDVVKLLRRCKKILVLTGAGVSVSCGIPDFRSRDGIYARLAVDFPDLPDPQAMFDIHYFRKDPRPFFKFAREIWPGQFTPSRCHRFLRLLERQNKLLRNYTQNIDTLEQQANISNVINCHGSFATATCLSCKHRVDCKAIEHDIMQQRIPFCPICVPCPTQEHIDAVLSGNNSTLPPIMKPDIVFFGESMPDEFHNAIARDKEECDLVIVIGSSLKVRPVALIPSAIPEHVPQILINREPLRHCVFDVELLGDCDVIVNQLCHTLGEGQEEVCYMPPLQEITRLPSSLFTSRKASPIPSSSAMALAASTAVPKSRVKALQGESSRRDSGLSTDSEALEAEETKGEKPAEEEEQPTDEEAGSALKGWWQPRIRANLASSLPENTYFFPHDARYVFPGAELMYDPDTSICSSDSCHDSDEDFDQEVEESVSDRRETVDLEDLQPSLSSSPSHRFSMESYGIGVVDTDFGTSNHFNTPETE